MNDQTDFGVERRVLVLDDDQDFADTLARLLELEGYHVRPAHSGAEALAVLERFPAEVALIDIRMGEQDGLNLVSELRRRRPEVSCIMMTAYTSAETAIEALQIGAYDYLSKPFHTEYLLATLTRCFERIALTRARERAETTLRQRNKELEELNLRLQKTVDGMQKLSTYTTLGQLSAAVLEQVVDQVDARRGIVYLKEGGRPIVRQGYGPGFDLSTAWPFEPDDLLERVLTTLRPTVVRPQGIKKGGSTGGRLAPDDGPLLAFPMIGEGQELVGLVAVQAGQDRAFSIQDQEFGEILVSFASEAIRVVQALERLAGSEERLRLVLDNSPSLISLKDFEGRFVVVNKRFEEWHGQVREAAIGKTSHELFPEKFARLYAAQFDEVLDTGEVIDEEIEMPFADGVVHSLRVTKFPVLDAHGCPIGVGTIATDITDSRRAEAQLRQAQKMEALGQLTGGIAHDFNNLLAVILGNLDLIKDRVQDNTDDREIVEDALSSARSGAELTHRLLAFGRRQTLHPQPTEAGQLVLGMSRLLGRILGETIELTKVLNDAPWAVEVDRNQLETSLLNLAINSRDAMPDGGVLTIETARATLGRNDARMDDAIVPGEYVMVSVTDAGTGMPQEVVGNAIQPFFTTKEAGHGSGLGLSMVYGFVKQSGGHLEIFSTVGKGTTVKLYLPKSGTVAQEEDARPRTQPATSGNGERILVVEDKPDVRKFAKRILTQLGYDVLEAEDAMSALEILNSKAKVDLLFTDVVLPGKLNGVQLATEAQLRLPELKILYTTGYARDAVLPGDENRLIMKPFVKESLARLVRHILDAGGTLSR